MRVKKKSLQTSACLLSLPCMCFPNGANGFVQKMSTAKTHLLRNKNRHSIIVIQLTLVEVQQDEIALLHLDGTNCLQPSLTTNLVGMTWFWLTTLTKGLTPVLLMNFFLLILLLTFLGFLAMPTTKRCGNLCFYNR